MPKTTTHRELWKHVALSALFYLFLAAGAALALAVFAFETLVMPVIMFVMILALLTPRKYWSLRRRYRPVEVQDGGDAQQRLEFDADMKSIYGSKLLPVLYGALVMIVMTSLAIWLEAR